MKTCFLDMDGVIADWIAAMADYHQVPHPYLEKSFRGRRLRAQDWGMKYSEFWRPCTSVTFWKTIPKMYDADEIVDLVQTYYNIEDIVILSTPNYEAAAMAGKISWMIKNYPQFLDNYFFGKNKARLAHEDAILIDDCKKNTDWFDARGGTGILLPRAWNHRYPANPIETLSKNLEYLHG